MTTFKATVTNYNSVDNVVSTGLTLEQAVFKVKGNIYGYDNSLDDISDSINAYSSSGYGATFFCELNTGQVSIKMEPEAE